MALCQSGGLCRVNVAIDPFSETLVVMNMPYTSLIFMERLSPLAHRH